MYDRYYRDGTVAWVKTLDLNNSDVSTTDEYVTQISLDETALRVYPPGTVLVAMYGGFNQIGRTGLLRIPATVNQAITAIQPNPNRLSSEFLLATLNYRVGHWRSVASSSRKDPNITSQDIRDFNLTHPKQIEEQRAIAEALSDVDALIGALDKLIAKKRAIKLATMQQLLTGRKRLQGFSKRWVRKEIKEFAPLQRGFDLPTYKISAGPYPVIYSNGILNHHSQFMVKGPGIVTGRSGTIGKVIFVEQDFWPHNTTLWVTSFKANNPLFVYYLYSTVGFERFATGSGVPTFNRNDAHSYELLVPADQDEQAAIASVLSDMDAEIAALECRRDKTKFIKQGMMQELLTGRIRLI